MKYKLDVEEGTLVIRQGRRWTKFDLADVGRDALFRLALEGMRQRVIDTMVRDDPREALDHALSKL